LQLKEFCDIAKRPYFVVTPFILRFLINLWLFCDADWAADSDYKRFISGAAIYLGPNLVS